MEFTYYKGMTHVMRDSLRQSGVKVTAQNLEQHITESLTRAIVVAGGRPIQEVITFAHEAVHYLTSRRVIYVSQALAEQFTVTDFYLAMEGLALPYDIFEVCIDKNFEIMDGVQAPGVLAMVNPGDATINALTHFVDKALEPVQGMRMNTPDHLRDSIVLRYSDPFDWGLCHAVIPSNDPEKTIDEAIEDMGKKAMILVGTKDLNERDVEVQKSLARIVMGAICYLNTAKPDVRDYKDRQRPSYSSNATAVLIGKDVPRDVYYRMRKRHWRVLAHPRFHRDEQGRVRVVSVRPAQVHYGAKAKELPPEITDIEKKAE